MSAFLRNQISETLATDGYNGLRSSFHRVSLYRIGSYSVQRIDSDDMCQWCADNCEEGWGYFHFGNPRPGVTFFFENSEDCILFKLTWR